MNVKRELLNVINKLDEIEECLLQSRKELSNYDTMLSDLYHNIETNTNKINPMKLYAEVKRVLNERRFVKINEQISRIVDSGSYSLLDKQGRDRLKERLYKIPETYHNKYYSDDMSEIK